MGTRGRNADNVTTLRHRPSPPAHLTAPQAEVWESVVKQYRVDWFDESNTPLLEEYCRSVVTARHIRKQLKTSEDTVTKVQEMLLKGAAEPKDVAAEFNRYDKLLQMANRESKNMMSLATKMRLSQSTKYDRDKSRTEGTAKGAKPWE